MTPMETSMPSIPYVLRCDSITLDAGAGAHVVLSLYRRVGGVTASAPSGSITIYADAAGYVVGAFYTIDLAPVE